VAKNKKEFILHGRDSRDRGRCRKNERPLLNNGSDSKLIGIGGLNKQAACRLSVGSQKYENKYSFACFA
jgi:hypothetical protein